MKERPKIISIAGGKGGVGKSFIAANLAVSISELGKKVILVDLDFGGANLHTFIGYPNNNPGVGEFIKTKGKKLSEFIIQTKIENLAFIPGDGVTPFMANISFLQKHKLIKNIKLLDADYIILDLGAGSTYNIIDFYNIADRGLVICKPDFLSVISSLTFLKNTVLRKIERVLKNNKNLERKMKEVLKRPMESNDFSIDLLCKEISLLDESYSEKIKAVCHNERPGIIFNMGTEVNEMEIMKQFNSGLESILSIEADYFGFILMNNNVLTSIKNKIPFVNFTNESKVSIEIRQIAKRVVKYIDSPVKNSGDLLIESTKKFLDEREKN